MKKILIIFILVNYVLLDMAANAFQPKYAVRTSDKDIELKKTRALEWYKDNVDDGKFYGYNAKKHIDFLKVKALKWYENNISNNKLYFVHADHELAFTKKKAIRWYDKNSD